MFIVVVWIWNYGVDGWILAKVLESSSEFRQTQKSSETELCCHHVYFLASNFSNDCGVAGVLSMKVGRTGLCSTRNFSETELWCPRGPRNCGVSGDPGVVVSHFLVGRSSKRNCGVTTGVVLVKIEDYLEEQGFVRARNHREQSCGITMCNSRCALVSNSSKRDNGVGFDQSRKPGGRTGYRNFYVLSYGVTTCVSLQVNSKKNCGTAVVVLTNVRELLGRTRSCSTQNPSEDKLWSHPVHFLASNSLKRHRGVGFD